MNIVVGCCKASLFPQYVFEAVCVSSVQRALRQVFERWGRPHMIRVDNGPPWGGRTDLPTALTLWLIGLDIDVVHNRPYRPQENGTVERSHGVAKAWVDPLTCPDLATLQTRLDEVALIQRHHYPSCDGQPRTQTFPALAAPARPYPKSAEASVWSFERVLSFLAQQRWTRKVSSRGQISLYNRNYPVGRAYIAQMVSVRFIPQSREWLIEDIHGQEVSRCQALSINAQAVQALQIAYKKPSRRKNK